MRFQAPRGTQDVLPAESYKWQWLEDEFRRLTDRYGYREIRTPTFEDSDLFRRTAGETSDIVTKEMYEFKDKGDRDVTLKPEGTAPAMRALIEHSLCPPGNVLRMRYETPCFRYGRPQKGRLRELHQFGLELVGSTSPAADAEIIEVVYRYFVQVGIHDAELLINSIGRGECRQRYREAILGHVAAFLADQDAETRDRAEKNPLGLLDSKDPATQAALVGVPSVLDYLEDTSRERFDALQRLLTEAGVNYRVAPEIVRGLDYYTETVFEVTAKHIGASVSLCGGGRYDNLIREIGGSDTPSVGVGIGIERILLELEGLGAIPTPPRADAFVVETSAAVTTAARALVRSLRAAGLSVLADVDGRSMKSQLRQADKSGARFALVLGEDETAKGTVQVKNLTEGTQREVAWSDVVAVLREAS